MKGMASLRAKRPGTAVSTLRTAAASVYRERSLTRITDELDRDCATWADAFSKAAAAAESLVASRRRRSKGQRQTPAASRSCSRACGSSRSASGVRACRSSTRAA